MGNFSFNPQLRVLLINEWFYTFKCFIKNFFENYRIFFFRQSVEIFENISIGPSTFLKIFVGPSTFLKIFPSFRRHFRKFFRRSVDIFENFSVVPSTFLKIFPSFRRHFWKFFRRPADHFFQFSVDQPTIFFDLKHCSLVS